MKASVLVFCVIIISLFNMSAVGQEVISVMPYEVVGQKMIVSMRINDKTERFIFDTGAEKSVITQKYFKSSSLPMLDSISLIDANSSNQFYRQTKVNSLQTLDNKINLKNIGVAVLDNKAVDCFNVAGLVGSDLLAGFICIIDPKAKTITLTSAEKRSPESLRYAHSFKEGSGYMPIIEVMVNGRAVNMTFDSGCTAFALINQTVYKRLDSLSAVKTVAVGRGMGSIGIGGVQINNDIKKICIEDFRIGLAKFTNLVQITGQCRRPLLGMDLLNFGKIVIDYPRRLFYYIPFSKEPVIMKYIPQKFDITVINSKLAVGTVWGETAKMLSTGDIITHINGKPTGTYDFCTTLINGIEDVKIKGPIEFTIMTKEGKEVKIVY